MFVLFVFIYINEEKKNFNESKQKFVIEYDDNDGDDTFFFQTPHFYFTDRFFFIFMCVIYINILFLGQCIQSMKAHSQCHETDA
jgi:hypothetical protein